MDVLSAALRLGRAIRDLITYVPQLNLPQLPDLFSQLPALPEIPLPF